MLPADSIRALGLLERWQGPALVRQELRWVRALAREQEALRRLRLRPQLRRLRESRVSSTQSLLPGRRRQLMQQSHKSRKGQHDHTDRTFSSHHLCCVALQKMNTSPQAARTLARGRRTQNWLAICLVCSGFTNIAVPVYFWSTSHVRDQVVVFDLASGSLLLSPMVDPSGSKEILETLSTWAAKCILDRSPSGLDNDALASLIFNSETGKKVRDEFGSVRQQYLEKSLRSHVEIKSLDSQSIATSPHGPYIKVRVTGQVVITGVLNGQAIQDLQPVTLDLDLVRNPDLGKNRRYPLLVWGYSYANQNLVKK
jgi:hypothetical protein